jgi:Flp pilus assembly protein TadB
MNIQNPFESGHIKNYILAYVSVVVIMVLFFIASSLWRDNSIKAKKEFATQNEETKLSSQKTQAKIKQKSPSHVMLMQTPYEKSSNAQ